MRKSILKFFAVTVSVITVHHQPLLAAAEPVPMADRSVVFDIFSQGTPMPIDWGLDTAWPSEPNMVRGVRFLGADIINVARVSFQPWAQITEKGVLPTVLRDNLAERMRLVGLIGHKVNIALNLDAGDPTLHDVYDNKPAEWAKLIDATAAAVQEMGYNVVSAAPFNEPDYQWNGLSQFIFSLINAQLKNAENYPRFQTIRISGGNTLNCDQALPWYNALKANLDEGNTHQLAGSFDNYAEFFRTVRADGKYATADELHNVMEAMVGVEYGMQTGIWWGHADLVRGEFCKDSGGVRLAYAENRKAWSSAAVYRAPSGKIQAFVGSSERQAEPSTYRFISRSADVYFDGHGPTREFVTDIPGDYDSYQGPNQTSAEAVFHITSGEDIQPAVKGVYRVMNAGTKKALGFQNGTSDDLARLFVNTPENAEWQQWKVEPVPHTNGGDYSGYFITNLSSDKMMDVLNWSLDDGGEIIQWGFGGGHNQQWYLEYDSDSWFRIRSRYSGLYLTAESDGKVVQRERAESAAQLWRFLPADAEFETVAPGTPSDVVAQPVESSVRLSWIASPDNDVNSYIVLRAEAGSDGFNTIARGLKSTFYTDNSVEAGKAYSYKIVAEDLSQNRSAASAPVSATAAKTSLLKAMYAFNSDIDDETMNGFAVSAAKIPVFVGGYDDSHKALAFADGQWLQLPYSLCNMPEMTVMARVRCDGGDGPQHIFDFGMAHEASLSLAASDNGRMRLIAQQGDDVTSVDTDALAEGSWNHVAAVVSGSTMSLYLNGQLCGTARYCVESGNTMLSYLGRSQASDDVLFSGAMADVRVYNYPMSADQIAQLANPSTSGIDNLFASPAGVASVEYFDLAGKQLSAPKNGKPTIVRTRYADGTLRVDKLMD